MERFGAGGYLKSLHNWERFGLHARFQIAHLRDWWTMIWESKTTAVHGYTQNTTAFHLVFSMFQWWLMNKCYDVGVFFCKNVLDTIEAEHLETNTNPKMLSSMISPTYPEKIPQTSPNPHEERNSFINCWWNIRGIFQGYVGGILDILLKRSFLAVL